MNGAYNRSAAVMWTVLFRFGLFAVMAYFTVDQLICPTGLPLTADPSSWYFGVSLAGAAVLLGLAGWGTYHSSAGRPLGRDDLDAEPAAA